MHRNKKPCEEERRSVGMQEIRPSRRIGLGTNRESTSSSDRAIQQLQAEGAAEAFTEDVEDVVLCAVGAAGCGGRAARPGERSGRASGAAGRARWGWRGGAGAVGWRGWRGGRAAPPGALGLASGPLGLGWMCLRPFAVEWRI